MNNVTTNLIAKQASELAPLEKGHAFEDFIVTLFNERKFILLEWRSDKKASNGVFPVSCTFPDLEFDSRGKYKRRFAVECKWRQGFLKGGVYWAEKYQISNYINYQNKNGIPVLVAIGIGGTPSLPEKLFVTPLDHIYMHTHVFESHLIPFKRNPKQKIDDTAQLKLF